MIATCSRVAPSFCCSRRRRRRGSCRQQSLRQRSRRDREAGAGKSRVGSLHRIKNDLPQARRWNGIVALTLSPAHRAHSRAVHASAARFSRMHTTVARSVLPHTNALHRPAQATDLESRLALPWGSTLGERHMGLQCRSATACESRLCGATSQFPGLEGIWARLVGSQFRAMGSRDAE